MSKATRTVMPKSSDYIEERRRQQWQGKPPTTKRPAKEKPNG